MLVDTFAYLTKGVKKPQEQKTILVQERYSFNLKEKIPSEVIDKWTAQDIQQLTLDLLYGLKAFKDHNVCDGDFNFGNVLMQLDEEGHIVKAGFTDFECAEVLTAQSRQAFKDPLDPDYEILTPVISFLVSIYKKKWSQYPEILKEGFYKKKGAMTSGLEMFGQQYLTSLKALDQNSSTYMEDCERVLEPYADFEHMPTKTLEEIIAALEQS